MNFSFKYGGKNYISKHLQKQGKNFVIDLGNNVFAEAEKKEYTKYDAEEWVIYFKNLGKDNSLMFSEINDCDIEITLKNPEKKRVGHIANNDFPCITSMLGPVDRKYYDESDRISADEFQFRDEYIFEEGRKSYQNRGARSSDIMMPFFDLHSADAGVMIAIGWSGGWRIDFERKNETVRVTSGLKKTNFYLKPGEQIRTSSVLVMKYDGEDKYNKFRNLIKDHFSYKAFYPDKQDSVLAYSFWGALPSDKMIERINEMKDNGINFDTIWIDAMWYTQSSDVSAHKNGWGRYNGNWTVDNEAHPGKLRDVKKAVSDAGCELLLWCEPEYPAFKNPPVLSEHSDWFIDNRLLYYGNDEAYEYVKNMLCEMIEELDLVCYRQDFCHCPMEYFEKNDTPDRQGITEIKHISAMYRLWDELLQKYPKLIIDNCSSGGRRIDIESLKRSMPLFRSDYQCVYNQKAEVLQVHNAGISHYLPYNGCTCRFKIDTYSARSSFSSSWDFANYGAIFQSMEEEDFKVLKKCVDEYREIRKYFSCDFYNHGSKVYDDTSWSIFEYCDRDKKEGIIMAFRRCESPFENVKISLKGVESNEKISYKNLNSGEFFEGGRELEILLPEKRSSIIYKYKI